MDTTRPISRLGCTLLTFGVALCLTDGVRAGSLEESRKEADRLLEAALTADGGPGMMAAVVVDSQPAWSGAVGMADLEAAVPLSEDTRMRVGSVSKPLTAALVARLAVTGRLDLDRPIREILPEFPDKGHPITARQLATHTSGIRHYDFTNFAEANNMMPLESLEEALPRVWNDPLVAPPGTRYEYSSWGYNVLGAVAQRAAGRPFLDAFAELVGVPLGLADTVGDRSLDLVDRRTRFYTIRPGGAVINTIWRDSSDCYPSCGMLSTARDLARFATEVLAGETLGAEVRRLLSTPARLADGSEIDRTLGWEIGRREDGSVHWFGHGGETNGGIAIVRYYPDSGLAVAGIANYNFWYEGEPLFFETVATAIPALFAATGDL